MTRFFLIAAALLVAPCMAHAQSDVSVVNTQQEATTVATPPPVVLELFTSQGCAFCPPADKLMAQLAEQPGVIGLSCHVDYFNVRENSLGKSFCTKRQNDYNRLIGTGPRYTPQLVVNGHMDMIGYEGGKVSAAILKARSEKIASIAVKPISEGAYSYALPASQLGDASVRLLMAVYDRPKEITMTEGGNFGKKLAYVNVVSRISDLGTWDGKAAMQSIDPMFAPANAGMAIIAQDMKTGQIVAAGSIKR